MTLPTRKNPIPMHLQSIPKCIGKNRLGEPCRERVVKSQKYCAYHGDPKYFPKLCGARTKKGSFCKRLAMKGKNRCYIHGGTSTGPPLGSRNALKAGYATREMILLRKIIRHILQKSKKLINYIDDFLSE